VSGFVAVRTRLFARLREQAGTDAQTVEVLPGATVDDVYDALQKLHPALDPNRESVRAAVNQEFAEWNVIVAAGDEVAFIPPVSGGAHGVGVLFELTTDPLDARRIEAAVAHKGAGAICTFTGVVRDSSRGRSVTHLEYEAYAEMATAEMRKIAGEIAERWPQARVAMAHRTGRLEIGEASVVVCVQVGHRSPQGVGADLEEGARAGRQLLDRRRRLEAGRLILDAGDRDAVPDRDDHALQARVLRHQLVVERDVARLLVRGLDHETLAQGVVGNQ
jgi:molybdopterin synthase catalytic subunit